jgi:hypothetical protein
LEVENPSLSLRDISPPRGEKVVSICANQLSKALSPWGRDVGKADREGFFGKTLTAPPPKW